MTYTFDIQLTCQGLFMTFLACRKRFKQSLSSMNASDRNTSTSCTGKQKIKCNFQYEHKSSAIASARHAFTDSV